MTNPLSLIPASAFKPISTGKFAPKLSTTERCEVLALVLSNIQVGVVAAAYGVDRRTVGHVVNPTSAHYKEVRKEMKQIGQVDFIAKYLTEDVAKRVRDATPAQTAMDHPTGVAAGGPSARANGKAGIHVVKPEQCAYSHRLEIKWLSGIVDIEEDGWHYRDLDSKSSPDVWLHNGIESLMTSQAALAMAEANLTDD